MNWDDTGSNPLPPEHIRGLIEGLQPYHFHDTGSTSPMKTTADVNDNRYLRPDGSNLAAFLFLLREKHGGSCTQIRRTIQLAAPFFDDFTLEPLALNEDKIRLEWRHSGSDAYFDASSLSDGTLRFIALTTLLLQPASLRPSVVLLDEPELGLHPHAITLLASMLKQASVGSQIIVATQSPVLLDHFEPEDVIVADRVEGGNDAPKAGRREPRSLVGGVQPGSALGKERNRRTSLPGGQRPSTLTVTRLLFHVEGQTEEQFVNELLAPHLYEYGFSSIGARLVGNARQRERRGGIKAWRTVCKEITNHLKADTRVPCHHNGGLLRDAGNWSKGMACAIGSYGV